MKLSKKLLFKAASLSMVAAISFGLGASLTKTNSASIETKAELSGTWTEDSYWLQYTDPSYYDTRIEQAIVSSEDGVSFNMTFSVFGKLDESADWTYLEDAFLSLYDGQFISDEDEDRYGYVTGYAVAGLNGIDTGTELNIYVMKSAEIIGNVINSYDEGWNYDSENKKLFYYSSDHGGVYNLEIAKYKQAKEEFDLVCYPVDTSDRDEQRITIQEANYNDGENLVSGLARLGGESSTAEEVSFYVVNKDNQPVSVNTVLYWTIDGNYIVWIDENITAIDLSNLNTVVSAIFYDYHDPEIDTFEITYHYDDIDLPTLEFQPASIEETSDGYSVTGVCSSIPGSSQSFTFTVRGEIEIQDQLYRIDYLPGCDEGEYEGETEPYEGQNPSTTAADCGFTRDGLNFAGWALEPSGEKAYDAGDPITLRERQNTLYALWEYPYSFTITLDPNGAPDDTIVEKVEGSTSPLSYEFKTCSFERPGYSFMGWGLEPNGSAIYYPGNTKEDITSDAIFYAIWNQTQFTLSLYPNGGEGDVINRSVERGENNAPSCPFTRDGYDFAGWALGSETSEVIIEANEPFNVEQDMDLYATWDAVAPAYRYEITLDANDGSGRTESEIIEGDNYNLTYTFKTCPYTRDGYSFKGWGTTPNATEVYQPSEEKNDISESTTFYAIWEQTTFTLTLVANDGSEDTSTVTVEKGNNPIPGCSFTREGFKFAGWAVGSPDSETILEEGDIINILKDYTLYATWTAYYSYTITLDPNGGEGTMEPEVIEGSSSYLTYTFKTCSYTRDGYTFKGWAFQPEGGITFQPGDTRTDIDKDTTFYAIWEQATFTINFYANGGEGTMESQSVPKGNNPVPSCAFTKEGYDFAGWAVGSPESSTIIQPGSSVNVTQDYDLYATWKVSITYTITFNANGGQGTMESIELSPGVYPAPGCDFTYEGHYFAGWAINSPDGEIVKEGRDFSVETDITLYAVWKVGEGRWIYTDETLYWQEGETQFEVEISQGIYSDKNSSISLVADIYNEDDDRTFYITKYILLTDVILSPDDPHMVEGYFSELGEVVRLYVEEVSKEIDPEDIKDEPLTPEQESQIKTLLPESGDARAAEILEGGEISQQTAYDIYTAVSDTKTEIDNKRQTDPTYTEEEYQKDVETLQTITEASVVVGAGSEVAEVRGEAIESAIPSESGLTQPMDEVLAEFYQIQMDYLLGKKPVPEKGEPNRKHLISRAGEEEPGIDLSVEEYDKMIDFVDESVENMESAALQIRNCSGAELKAVVNDYIQTVKISSFRDFDKAAADEEYVEQAYHSIMVTMQQQVIEALEKDHQPSTNQEKEAQYQEQLEAVKDYDTFEQIVIEVLRLKYVSATGQEIDYETFETIYMDIFRAWALNDESLNPYGITLEELTTATIETTTHKANKMTFSTNFTTGEKVFFFSMLGVVALAAGGITAYAVVSKKKRGLAK